MRKQTSFDPYHKWLGIPPKDQPPNHYRLIGIDLFETDADVIDTAANKQMTYLHGCSTGEHSAFAEKLMNEIAAVRLCLLDPKQKAEYDEKLKKEMSAATKIVSEPDEPLFALKLSSEVAASSQKKRSFVLPVIAVAVIVSGGLVGFGFLQSKPDQDSGPVDQVAVTNTDSKAEEKNVETSSVSGLPEAESASVPPQPKTSTSELTVKSTPAESQTDPSSQPETKVESPLAEPEQPVPQAKESEDGQYVVFWKETVLPLLAKRDYQAAITRLDEALEDEKYEDHQKEIGEDKAVIDKLKTVFIAAERGIQKLEVGAKLRLNGIGQVTFIRYDVDKKMIIAVFGKRETKKPLVELKAAEIVEFANDALPKENRPLVLGVFLGLDQSGDPEQGRILRKFHDPWHRLTLHGRCAPSKTVGINHKNTYYCKAA